MRRGRTSSSGESNRSAGRAGFDSPLLSAQGRRHGCVDIADELAVDGIGGRHFKQRGASLWLMSAARLRR